MWAYTWFYCCLPFEYAWNIMVAVAVVARDQRNEVLSFFNAVVRQLTIQSIFEQCGSMFLFFFDLLNGPLLCSLLLALQVIANVNLIFIISFLFFYGISLCSLMSETFRLERFLFAFLVACNHLVMAYNFSFWSVIMDAVVGGPDLTSLVQI